MCELELDNTMNFLSRQAQGKKQKAFVSHLEDRLLCGDEELLGRVE